MRIRRVEFFALRRSPLRSSPACVQWKKVTTVNHRSHGLVKLGEHRRMRCKLQHLLRVVMHIKYPFFTL